jgi:hypothetical protein
MTRLQYLEKKKKSMISLRTKLFSDLSKIDQLKADIDHILELNDLSGSQLLQTASKLSKLLKMRGHLKDNIRKIDFFIPALDNLIKMETAQRGDGKANFVKKDDFLDFSLEEVYKKATFNYEEYKDFFGDISVSFEDEKENEKVSV